MSDLDLLYRAVRLHFDALPSEIERFETWGPHSVLSFRCGSRRLFWKTQQPGRCNQAEAWACAMARSAGLPAPEIVAVDAGADGGVPYLLMYQLPGRPLTLDDPAAPVVERFGRLLCGYNRVPISGYGRLHPAGQTFRGQYPSWQAFFTTSARQFIERARVSNDLDTTLERSFTRTLERFDAELAAVTTPRLLNGDLHLGSLFVSEQLELVGVIDFADVSGGDVLWEVARFSVEVDRADASEQPCVAELARGLGLEAALQTPLFRLYRAYWALQELAWAREFTPQLVERPRGVLATILAELS